LDVFESMKLPERGPVRKIVEEVVREAHEAKKRKENVHTSWGRLKLACEHLVHHDLFEIVTGLIIMCNMVTIYLEAELGAVHGEMGWMRRVEEIFLGIYTIELAIRSVAGGWRIFRTIWHLTDLFLVACGVFALIVLPLFAEEDSLLYSFEKILVMRCLRLLRLIRGLRMISHFKVMWRLVYSLLTCGSTMLAVTVLVLLALFTFGLLFMELIANDPDLRENPTTRAILDESFGSLTLAMLTLVQFVTMDSLADLYMPIIQLKPVTVFIFGPVLVIVSIGLMNLVTAVLVENALEMAQQEAEEEKLQLKSKVKKALPVLLETFTILDVDKSGYITREEIEHVSVDVLPPKVLDNVSVDSMVDLFEMFDLDQTGKLEVEEFIGGLLNLILMDVPIWAIQAQRMLVATRTAVARIEQHVDVLCQQPALTVETSVALGFA